MNRYNDFTEARELIRIIDLWCAKHNDLKDWLLISELCAMYDPTFMGMSKQQQSRERLKIMSRIRSDVMPIYEKNGYNLVFRRNETIKGWGKINALRIARPGDEFWMVATKQVRINMIESHINRDKAEKISIDNNAELDKKKLQHFYDHDLTDRQRDILKRLGLNGYLSNNLGLEI